MGGKGGERDGEGIAYWTVRKGLSAEMRSQQRPM